MTEAEWLACDEPAAMIKFIRGRTTSRKLRWFAIACCRQLDDLLEDREIQKVLTAAERYADGLIRDSTAAIWYRRGGHALDSLPNGLGEVLARRMAYSAVQLAVLPNRSLGYLRAHAQVAMGIADRARNRLDGSWRTAVRNAEKKLVPLLHDVIGNPFVPLPVIDPSWLAWNQGAVARLAKQIYDDRAFDRLPILADALEDAGCDDADLLLHCRKPGPHVPGCWGVDLLLGHK